MANAKHTNGWKTAKTVLIGIGNAGRGDDGLGWAFLDAIGKDSSFEGEVVYRYQLQVEDAALIAACEKVIFVDAYQQHLDGGFQWEACVPSDSFVFSTHELPPDAVLYLSQQLYDRTPLAHTLLIQGNRWDLKIGLSAFAQSNLKRALDFFENSVINSRSRLTA